MTEIRFYHMQRMTLDAALPRLLERALDRPMRAVVMAASKERVEALCGQLWTYDDRSFLPHSSEADGHPEHQPIWVTERDENPNGAQVLFLTDGMRSDNLGLFELVCVLFNGRDEAAVAQARADWKVFRDIGHSVTYWQQTDRGWEQKA